ncbi:MAG: histidinol-phosphatase [Actinobacteria bacterium]|nr:histidinol-phosphatase [Actinomycetota bacterium]
MTAAMDRDRSFANELADLAAEIALSSSRHGLRVTHKHDGTPVTQVDVAIERALRDAVGERFVGDGFLGEEGGGSIAGGRVWVVDPIDGTKNFVDGIQIWSVLVALLVDGVPVLGVVDLPGLGERYEGVRGGGAWLNGEPITVSKTQSLADALVVHSGVEEWATGPYWDGFLRVATGCRRTRGLGDAWGFMLLARGSADAVMEHEPCGVWDWAAVRVIVEEAGGRLTTLEGVEPHASCDLLASNGSLHEEVLARLHDAGSG